MKIGPTAQRFAWTVSSPWFNREWGSTDTKEADSGTWFALQKCGTNKYCCPPANGADCCENGSKVYTLAAPEASAEAETETNTDTEIEPDATDAAGSGLQSAIRTTSEAASAATDHVNTDGPEKSSPPIGAIVGGVVGGVAVLGLLFLGACCVFRRRRRRSVPYSNRAVTDDTNTDRSNFGNDKTEVQILPRGGVAGNKRTEDDSLVFNVARPQEAKKSPGGSVGTVHEADSKPIDQVRIRDTRTSDGNVADPRGGKACP
ncbi:hypothetical protein F66182_5783 [Fusarium sp. NRRL 66182]|nr:hypothetical protein F66182_5783 [Fusarium sp. NRRL 66182]